MEALACGTPVVATDVGGIPEQVKDLGHGETWRAKAVGEREATGILTPPQDPNALASAIAFLLGRDDLLHALSVNAGEDARRRFDVQTQVDAYLAWYREIIGGRATGAKGAAPEESGP
jgi:glycosyltransferase involved in cell wall biosynthesis